MPGTIPTITNELAAVSYLTGRLLSGCDSLKDRGSFADYDETWGEAIEFGEWDPVNAQQTMPKAVITNATFTAKNTGEDSGNFVSAGQIAVLVFMATDLTLETESERELDAFNFFGNLVAEIMAQSGNLENPGDQYANRTLFINQVDLMGPTRTSKEFRGPNGENDYYDGVLMIDWGQQV